MYTFTMDSFGPILPNNWQEIVDYLNAKLDAMDVDNSDELHDAMNQLWDDYCNGDLPDAPEEIYEEDDTND